MMDGVEVYDVRTVCLHTIKRDKGKTYDLIIVLRGNLKSLLICCAVGLTNLPNFQFSDVYFPQLAIYCTI